jgi:hypothetical protein
MIKQFKEIEEFFTQDQFSEIELEAFKLDLKNKYGDKNILKQAMALVSLKLIVFRSNTASQKALPDILNIIQNIIKNDTKANKLESELEKKIESEIKNFKGKTVGYIANTLGFTSPKFIILLSQQGLSCKESDKLTKHQFQNISKFLEIKLRKLYQFRIKEKPKNLDYNRLKIKNKSSNSVYDELKSFGPGKVIYIRSK